MAEGGRLSSGTYGSFSLFEEKETVQCTGAGKKKSTENKTFPYKSKPLRQGKHSNTQSMRHH